MEVWFVSSTDAEIRDFDPFSSDPQQQLTALRARGRVLRSPAMNDARLVLTDADCRAVLVDDQSYSSAFAMGGPLAANNSEAVIQALPAFLRADGLTAIVDADMPAHAELRRTMRRAYEPGWIQTQVPAFRATAEALIGELPPEGEVDLVARYCRPFVQRVMCGVMGVPDDMVDRVSGWARDMETIASPPVAFTEEAKLAAAERLVEYEAWAGEFVAARRDERDAIGIYAHGDGDRAQPLPRAVAMYTLLVHFVAGTVTTGHALSSTFEQLLRRPELWSACTADPEGYAPDAFEEAMRFAAPHRGLVRLTTTETTLNGETVPPGTMVLPMLQSANRDEEHFEQADQFCPGRERARDHIAFGHGRHLCVGAELARKEAAEAIAAFATAHPNATLVDPDQDAPVEPNYFFHGPAALAVRLG